MSQVVDVNMWMKGQGDLPVTSEATHADLDAPAQPIPPLRPDRRRRSLPLRGAGDRRAYELLS